MSGSAMLAARLKSGANRLARCWEVVRGDGVRLGFTDHDLDLAFDGLTFEAASGLDAGALERSTGLNVDNAQAVGALRSDRVSESDILMGRYDGAVVRQWLVDWAEPEARIQLFEGTLGEVRASGGAFEAELRGLAEALNQPLGRAYLKTCDRDLGDAKCGVDLSDPTYSLTGTVEETADRLKVVFTAAGTYGDGWFTGGALTWQSGANAGLGALVRADVIAEERRELTLWIEARAGIAPGDTFRLVAGCDKYVTTCRDKFANVLNFRGFPHMPGEDWVTSYPRSGEVHDGQAVYWEERRDD